MHTASSAAPPGAVVAEDVSKVFFSGTDPVWALEDFSLTLEPGSSPASSARPAAGSRPSCASWAGSRSAPSAP